MGSVSVYGLPLSVCGLYRGTMKLAYAMMLLVVLAACATPEATPTPAPSFPAGIAPEATPTPAPSRPAGIAPIETYIEHATVIVVGVVEDGEPEVLAGRSFYRDWEVRVEQYVTAPLSYDRLVVRTFTGATDSAGNRMPVKMPTLATGERVLLFLNRDWDEPPLGSREFTMPDPLGGKFLIRDGKVHVRFAGEPEEHVPRDVEAVVEQITRLLE